MKAKIREVTIVTPPNVTQPIPQDIRERLEAALGKPFPETKRYAPDESPYHGKIFIFLSLDEADRFISDYGPKILRAQSSEHKGRSILRFVILWENGLTISGFFRFRDDGLGEWRCRGHIPDYVPFREYIGKTVAWDADHPPETVGVGPGESKLFAIFSNAHRRALKIRSTCEIPSLDDIPDPEVKSKFDRWLDAVGEERGQPDTGVS